jgi:hypothetical protein
MLGFRRRRRKLRAKFAPKVYKLYRVTLYRAAIHRMAAIRPTDESFTDIVDFRMTVPGWRVNGTARGFA